MKKLISIFLLLALFLSMIPAASAETTKTLIDELRGFAFDGKAFEPQNYPKNTDDTNVYVLAVDEVGYRQGGDLGEFGLYLYLYNPSGKQIRNPSNSNKVEMAVAWNANGEPTEYEKFAISRVDVSTEAGFENVFLKYLVIDRASTYDGKTIKERVRTTPYKRIYAIAGIELSDLTSGRIIDYGYGAQIEVSGYEDSTSQKKSTMYRAMETLELDVNMCYWRTQTSSKGAGWKHQITGAYFSVPNSVWNKYEQLYSIKCVWDEHKTTPMIITDDDALYNALYAQLGKTMTSYDSSIPFLSSDIKSIMVPTPVPGTTTTVLAPKFTSCNYAFNPPNTSAYSGMTVKNPINSIAWLFKSSGEIELGKESVSSKRLLQYYNTYKGQPYIGNQLLLDTVDEGREEMRNGITVTMDTAFDLSNYDSSHNWIQKIIDYNFFNGGLTLNGFTVDTGETYQMKPIEIFKPNTVNTNKVLSESLDYIMTTHFLGDADQAASFQRFVERAKNNDETVVLFRFASTDYFSETLQVYNPQIDGHAFVSQQTMFLDFDVIQLQFTDKAQQIRTLAVTNDPQDAIGPAVSPETSTDADLVWNQFANDLEELLGQFMEIFGIVILIMIVIALIPVGTMLYDAIMRMIDGGERQKRPRGRQRHLRKQSSERKKK